MFNRRQEVVANLIAFIYEIELEACEALAGQEGVQEATAGKLLCYLPAVKLKARSSSHYTSRVPLAPALPRIRVEGRPVSLSYDERD